MTSVVHIAGVHLAVNTLVRQRCAWCGALLVEFREAVARFDESEPGPAVWPVGHFVAVDGGMKWLVLYEDGNPFPDGLCASLDPAVTR